MTSPRRSRPPVALPTAAELDILAVLWRLSAATVREVHEELDKSLRGQRPQRAKAAADRGRLAETAFRRYGQESGAGGAGGTAGLTAGVGGNPQHASRFC